MFAVSKTLARLSFLDFTHTSLNDMTTFIVLLLLLALKRVCVCVCVCVYSGCLYQNICILVKKNKCFVQPEVQAVLVYGHFNATFSSLIQFFVSCHFKAGQYSY
ncbi:TPA: hypothetical protein GDO54_018507 [Pyxicephalus adspersus]|uniref:Secreted protein n=1 Tax=Pyxicephalus adspersus TaxID=30357 RepID=A0AAV2ZT95_PYXAD|nr:TPA: hypothetical protein GDO54_018507 [Pyxicephalus adspersus]